MSERHYWPEQDGEYLVEKKDGTVTLLKKTGIFFGDYFIHQTSGELTARGYLGVRKPFDEADERAAFEVWFRAEFPHLNQPKWRSDMEAYDFTPTQKLWRGWLAAKRHERCV